MGKLIPEAYRLGEWDFYNITLKITPAVLIPRPDSEHLVEVALEYISSRGLASARILDLCCGSGCIGLAIAANAPGARVTYADISEPALEVARSNGCRDILRLDALKPPPEHLLKKFHLLVCNPPYVAHGDPALDDSVLSHEPHIALFGGEDGFDFYRSLFAHWTDAVKPDGLFAVEVGYNQAQKAAWAALAAGRLDDLMGGLP